MNGVAYSQLLRWLAPEWIVTLTAFGVLGADLGWWRDLPPGTRALRGAWLAAGGLLAACLAAAVGAGAVNVLEGTLALNSSTQALKTVLFLLAASAGLLCAGSFRSPHPAEFLALILFSSVGLCLLVSTQNLLVAFVALELASLSLYGLTAFDKRTAASAEAGLKYFLFGGMAAAFTLFGFSLLYGLSGSLQLPAIAQKLADHPTDPLTLLALVFVVAGLSFKVAAAPFHFWAPDAYEGAPAPAAAFIASGSKIGGFVILGRLLQEGVGPAAAGSGSWRAFAPGWVAVVALVAAASIVLGNLAALGQSSLRRLLAYSAVAHAGYALLAVIGGKEDATPALLYYVVTYAVSSLGAFGVVAAMPAAEGKISDLAGLRDRSPLLAWTLTVFVLSLAGLPPLAGFFAKFYAFVAAAKAAPSPGLLWLVFLALAGSCVSLYYYLRILRAVWVQDRTDDGADGSGRLKVRPPIALVLGGAAILVVVAGCFPQALINWLS